MSDILTITRGLSGYGCIIRGVGDPGSPLASLLFTSGLVACYLPYLQVAQSATGQSLIDYSPAGNHAQLGSTAGADANDPSWGTNALTFGGDDYCVLPTASFVTPAGSYSVVMVFYLDDIPGFYNILWECSNPSVPYRNGFNIPSTGELRFSTHTDSYSTIGGTILQKQKWYVVIGTNVSGTKRMNINGVSSATPSDGGYVPLSGHYLGGSGNSLVGQCGGFMLINRALSIPEETRIYNNLKTLLAGQGVSLA